MRFSLIATALALSLTVSASQVDRRELDQAANKCVADIKDISDYLPTLTNSIKKATSYVGVIDAHMKEDVVEKKIEKAIKACKIVASPSNEIIAEFTDILKPLIENIQEVSDALVKKKQHIDKISLAKPLLEDSLRKIYKDFKVIEGDLIRLCPKGRMEEFKVYIYEFNDAFENLFADFNVDR